MTSIPAIDTSAIASTVKGATIGADFNMFLKLLTTQMQHQDPLDPMDTSQYTQQLVQYSQVEQSVQQTTALKDILSRLTAQDMAQASAFIGREATFDSAVSGLGAASPVSWTVRPERTAASLAATISDAAGRVVHRADLDPAGGRVAWDGALADGTRAPEGAYTLAVVAKDAGGEAVDTTINSVGLVRDVVTDGGAVTLGIGGVRLPVERLVAVAGA